MIDLALSPSRVTRPQPTRFRDQLAEHRKFGIGLLLAPIQTGTSSRSDKPRYATAVPSSSTIWPGIASLVTSTIVVVGATPAAPSRPASSP